MQVLWGYVHRPAKSEKTQVYLSYNSDLLRFTLGKVEGTTRQLIMVVGFYLHATNVKLDAPTAKVWQTTRPGQPWHDNNLNHIFWDF